MRLDETRITIRERGLLEILDLSLKVAAAYPGLLLASICLPVLALMALNTYLIGWIAYDFDDFGQVARYLWTMTLLVFIEAPLVSIPVTLLLGRIMFIQPAAAREILRDMVSFFPQIAWCHLVLRGIVLAWILMWMVPDYSEYTSQEALLMMLAMVVAVIRAVRPFITEIIVLERNPLRSKQGGEMTVARRSTTLHNPNSGDLLARWLGCAILGALMVVALLVTMTCISGMLFFQWEWGPVMLHVGAP